MAKCCAVWCGLLLTLLLIPNRMVVAQAEGVTALSHDVTTTDQTRLPLVLEDARFLGMYSERSFPFYLPEDWVLMPELAVNLRLHHSELIDNSNLTLFINGAPIATTALPLATTGLPLGSPDTWPVVLPVDKVLQGWNTLRLRFYLRINEDPCLDLDNPGLWAVLDARSWITVPHRLARVEPNLELFPGSYLQPVAGDASHGPQVRFLLPSDLGPATLETAALLAARLGQTRSVRGDVLAAHVLNGAVPDGLADSHLIFVGEAGDLEALRTLGIDPAPVEQRFEGLLAVNSKARQLGALIEIPNPLSPHKRFLAAVANSAAGMNVLKANLGRAAYTEGLSGATQAFTTDPSIEHREAHDVSKVTFAALDLPDMAVRGLSSRSVTFKVPIPRHWALTEQSHLKLFVDHSISLKKNTTFEVDINGAPVYGLELAPETGINRVRTQEITVPIPANLRDADTLNIGFRLFLDVGSDDCSSPYDDSAWAVVRNNSYAYLAHHRRSRASLDQYPDLFMKDAELSQVGLVLGMNAGSQELSTLLSIAAVLGSESVASDPMHLVASTWERFEPTALRRAAGRDWIIIGPANIAAFTRGVKQRLPAPLDADGRLGVSFRRVNPMPEGVDGAGIIQLMASPWESDRAVLLVTAHAPIGMSYAGTILGNPWTHDQLNGNVTLVTARDRTYYYDIWDEVEPKPSISSAPETEVNPWLLLTVSVTVFLLALFLYRVSRDKE